MSDKEFLSKLIKDNFPQFDFMEHASKLDISFDESIEKWAEWFVDDKGRDVKHDKRQIPGAIASYTNWLKMENKKSSGRETKKAQDADDGQLDKQVEWVLRWIRDGWKSEVNKTVRNTVRKRILELRKKGREKEMEWLMYWVTVKREEGVPTVEILGNDFDKNCFKAKKYREKKMNWDGGEHKHRILRSNACYKRELRNGSSQEERSDTKRRALAGKKVNWHYDKTA